MDREDLPEVKMHSEPFEFMVQPYYDVDEHDEETFSGHYICILSYGGEPYGVSFGTTPYKAVFQCMMDVPIEDVGILHQMPQNFDPQATDIIQFLDEDGKPKRVDPSD